MKTKDELRRKFLALRKIRYFDVSDKIFIQLSNYVKTKFKIKKKIYIALYYPSNYEINVFKIMKYFKKSQAIFLLPKIKEGNFLEFFKWTSRDVLEVNKFGIPEPIKSKKIFSPDVVLVPLLAFDGEMNRLGYGKGFYDKYLNNLIKLNKKIKAIGVAFSFQRYKKIPSSKLDFKLNNIFTEKGFI